MMQPERESKQEIDAAIMQPERESNQEINATIVDSELETKQSLTCNDVPTEEGKCCYIITNDTVYHHLRAHGGIPAC